MSTTARRLRTDGTSRVFTSTLHRSKAQRPSRIALFTLLGAVGCTAGGALPGLYFWLNPGNAFLLDSYLGFGIMGATVAVVLGIALKGRKAAITSAALGAVGFLSGSLLGHFGTRLLLPFVQWLGPDLLTAFHYGAQGALTGAIGGAAIALALLGWRRAGRFARFGALGLGASLMVAGVLHLDLWLSYGLMGVIAGAYLGAGAGHLGRMQDEAVRSLAGFGRPSDQRRLE